MGKVLFIASQTAFALCMLCNLILMIRIYKRYRNTNKD